MTGAIGVVRNAGSQSEVGVPQDFADPDGPPEGPFELNGCEQGAIGDYAERMVGEARVIDVRATRLLLRETAAFAQSRPPQVMLHAVIEGRPVYYDGRGDQIVLRPGALVVRRAGPAASIRSDRTARVVTVILAQHLLVPRFAAATALDHCTVQTENALPQRLLHGFIVGLVEPDESPWLNAKSAIVDGLGGLVSMIAAQTPPARTELSELAAERAAAILRHLRRNFANPLLTPSMMADDLNISVRYAHKLMQMTGRSFREELVALRLEAARLAFAANAKPRQTIAGIAISVGFNDLSQFNRHFRAAFGMTPRAARKLDETNGYHPEPRDDAPREDARWGPLSPSGPRVLDGGGLAPQEAFGRPLSLAAEPG